MPSPGETRWKSSEWIAVFVRVKPTAADHSAPRKRNASCAPATLSGVDAAWISERFTGPSGRSWMPWEAEAMT